MWTCKISFLFSSIYNFDNPWGLHGTSAIDSFFNSPALQANVILYLSNVVVRLSINVNFNLGVSPRDW